MAARRGHNEGTIYPVAGGGFRGAVTSPLTGKRKYCSGRTKKEVREQLDKMKARFAQGFYSFDSRQTVEAYLTTWLTNRPEGALKPRTRESYEGAIRLHIVPAIGHVKLSQLTPAHIQQVLNEKAKVKSPYLVRNVRAVLRAALNQAVKHGHLVRNVASLVETPKVPPSKVRPLSLEEARNLLASLRGHRFESLFVVAMLTGMRRGEVLGLRWEDIDFEERVIRVTGSLQRIGRELARFDPKTERSRRTIEVPRLVVEALEGQRTAQKEARLKAGASWQQTDYVFTTAIGTPVEPRNAYREFVKAVEAAGLPKQRFHDLRHGFATLQLAEGVPLRAVSELLGHTQIGTTADIYQHVTKPMQREAMDRLDALFEEAS